MKNVLKMVRFNPYCGSRFFFLREELGPALENEPHDGATQEGMLRIGKRVRSAIL